MIVLSKNSEQFVVQLTCDEMALIAGAFNELFEIDFDDGEFHTRLGSTKQEADTLRSQFLSAYG
jgi:hypothetical protein